MPARLNARRLWAVVAFAVLLAALHTMMPAQGDTVAQPTTWLRGTAV